VGLGKGKPFCASKIAKKKLGLPNSMMLSVSGYGGGGAGGGAGPGRPPGAPGPGRKGAFSASSYQKKNQRMVEFGRKRGTKSKMRGLFGVPGLGLQVNICFFFA